MTMPQTPADPSRLERVALAAGLAPPAGDLVTRAALATLASERPEPAPAVAPAR